MGVTAGLIGAVILAFGKSIRIALLLAQIAVFAQTYALYVALQKLAGSVYLSQPGHHGTGRTGDLGPGFGKQPDPAGSVPGQPQVEATFQPIALEHFYDFLGSFGNFSDSRRQPWMRHRHGTTIRQNSMTTVSSPKTSRQAWWLLRHAPTLGAAGCFAGSSDRPIGAVGDADAAALVKAVGPIDVAVVTPLRRTTATLERLRDNGLRVPRLLVERDLAEQDFGCWEEQAYDLLAKLDPNYWPFWDDPVHARPPGGESFADVCRRTLSAYVRLERALDGARVLHVGHAGPIRAMLAAAEGGDAASALGRVVAPLSLRRLSPCDPGKPRGPHRHKSAPGSVMEPQGT